MTRAIWIESQPFLRDFREVSFNRSVDPLRHFRASLLERRTKAFRASFALALVSMAIAGQGVEIKAAETEGLPPRASSGPTAPAASADGIFEDVSARLAHRHHETEFNDFDRQPLLPKKLSQAGPAVSWLDWDGDGHEDLIIGAGKGGSLAIYRNDGQGGFTRLVETALDKPAEQDQAGILAWRAGNGQARLIVASPNYEDAPSNRPSLFQFAKGRQALDPAIAGTSGGSAALAMADLAGDGNLALFVAGAVVPGRYPESFPSRIVRQAADGWTLDVENTHALQRAGLVNGAVWSDLDGDGFPELILAVEWGPVRVFKNARGKLHEVTSDLGLAPFTGWWSGVTTGDMDGDGQLDIIAGNWGLNSPYRASPEKPLKLFYGDSAGRGILDLIETEYESDTGRLVPRRYLSSLAGAIPFMRGRFPSFKAFSEASIDTVLAGQKEKLVETEVTTLSSTIFFQRKDRFVAAPLPDEAQFAPAFSVNVADFDGDGLEDLFLAQNFFALQPEMPRIDAGRGLWLKGIGQGRMAPVPGQTSGVKVYGEQRSAAICDFNEDGLIDLVVTQNAAETKLFRNVGDRTGRAKPGLRVRLAGPAGNPSGIGACLRLMTAQGAGPIREIHAGSGYLAQDSAVQVLARPDGPVKLWIRWPGGKVTTVDVPPNCRELLVGLEGIKQSLLMK